MSVLAEKKKNTMKLELMGIKRTSLSNCRVSGVDGDVGSHAELLQGQCGL